MPGCRPSARNPGTPVAGFHSCAAPTASVVLARSSISFRKTLQPSQLWPLVTPGRASQRGQGQNGDPPIRSTLERPVLVACPIDAMGVLNGTDHYRLQCYLWPEKNCVLWNGMMAPSPPPRNADEDSPRPDHTQEEAV